MNTEEKKTISFYEIAEYWADKNITENGEIILNADLENCEEETLPVVVDLGEPRCFCCGAMQSEARYGDFLDIESDLKKIWNSKLTTKHFEKAHIVAKSLGGKVSPDNMFCLCKECHRESPDTIFPEVFLSWIFRRRKNPKDVSIYDDAIDACKRRGIPLFYLTPPHPSKDKKVLDEIIATHKSEMVDSSRTGVLIGLADRRRQKIENVVDELKNDLYTQAPDIILMVVGCLCRKEERDEISQLSEFLDNEMEASIRFAATWVNAFKTL